MIHLKKKVLFLFVLFLLTILVNHWRNAESNGGILLPYGMPYVGGPEMYGQQQMNQEPPGPEWDPYYYKARTEAMISMRGARSIGSGFGGAVGLDAIVNRRDGEFALQMMSMQGL